MYGLGIAWVTRMTKGLFGNLSGKNPNTNIRFGFKAEVGEYLWAGGWFWVLWLLHAVLNEFPCWSRTKRSRIGWWRALGEWFMVVRAALAIAKFTFEDIVLNEGAIKCMLVVWY